MLHSNFKLISVAAAYCISFSVIASEYKKNPDLEEITVYADFYGTTALQLASSATIMDEAVIQQRNAQHLEQLLGLAPNVNYATGASRGRFIQIRGIGERSEFFEPVNYSVGVLIDGIDFTGISTGATTLDIQQVEVLRGPQGTLYGANALAGLINMVSNGPTEETEGIIEATLADYNTRSLEGALGGSLSESVGYRIAARTYVSEGYIENTYLERDDTADFDETSLRGKLNFQLTDDWSVGLTTYYADIDNGYDAFSFESNRKTRSNEPGHDRQETVAFAISSDYQINSALSFETDISANRSNIEYGYDEDWRNPEFCSVEGCVEDGYHSAFDNYARDNDNNSLDVRVKGGSDNAAWVLGIYYRDQDILLNQTYIDGYGGTSSFSSDFETTNTAFYGDLSVGLTDALRFGFGARVEERDTDFRDSDTFGFSTDETLWGGKLSLSYQLDDDKTVYALVSRGYKPGGANSNSEVPESFRDYDTETMINYELGMKGHFLDGRLESQLAIFYQDRNDIQTDSAIVDCSGIPCTFDDYLTNAAEGRNYGIETQLVFTATDTVALYASLGLLSAEYGSGYINYQHVEADEDAGEGFNMDGRDQPHAPSYQFVIGVDTAITDVLAFNINLEGKDDFLFSNDHEERSDDYVLVNADLTYSADSWRVSVWGKNLGDEEYQNRAFGSFSNDPRDGYSIVVPYYQLGDPRTFGFTVGYSF